MEVKQLLVIALVSTLGESSCPQECSCTDNSVLCIHRNLDKVPNFDELTDSPIIIDLSGNRISFVNEDDFSFMKNFAVKEIYLNNSEILDIDSTAFEELENLQELYLGENLLSSVPEDLIEELPDMILLDLSRNQFSGSMPLIKSNSLEVLAMANSKILSIPMDSLKYLPNLKMLLLQENNIKTINLGVFSYVGKKSFFLRMSYNAWECNCQNMKLFQFLDENKFIDKSDPYQCRINSSELINIYGNNAINSIKTKCQEKINIEVSTLKSTDKSYSLIKENSVQKIRSIDNAGESKNNSQTYQHVTDEVVSSEKEFKSTKCEKIEHPSILYDTDKHHIEIIIILCIFAIGFGVGCCLNQFLSVTRYRMLKPIDSNFDMFIA